jgi:hypothetical protein
MKWRCHLLHGAIAVVILIGCFVPSSYGEESERIRFGVSGLLGTEAHFIHNKPKFTKYGILPRMSIPLHRNWDLGFEGNFSYWALDREKNLFFAGLNTNILFKPFHWNWGSLFLLTGAGLGYDNSGGDVHEIGASHLGGTLQGGIGILYNLSKKLALRLEYRLTHVSEPTKADHGINSHDILFGVSF